MKERIWISLYSHRFVLVYSQIKYLDGILPEKFWMQRQTFSPVKQINGIENLHRHQLVVRLPSILNWLDSLLIEWNRGSAYVPWSSEDSCMTVKLHPPLINLGSDFELFFYAKRELFKKLKWFQWPWLEHFHKLESSQTKIGTIFRHESKKKEQKINQTHFVFLLLIWFIIIKFLLL